MEYLCNRSQIYIPPRFAGHGEIDFVYDVARLDEKLLLTELRNLGLRVRTVNIEEVVAPEGLGDIGVIRVAARSRVVPTAFTYEHRGGVAINSAISLVISHDKYLTYLRLVGAGVPTPATYLVFGGGMRQRLLRRS